MTDQPTIRSNFDAWLKHAGIDSTGLEFMQEEQDQFADRIWFKDPKALVLTAMLAQDASIDAFDSMHGSSLVLSVRERQRPSGQLCVHRVLDAITKKRGLVNEFDFDKAPPANNLKWVALHGWEVAVNCVTHGLTDQTAIAKGLRARGVIA